MKFRKNKQLLVPEVPTKWENELPELDFGPHQQGRGRWSTTFLIIGSALAGATALAFWNRRTIANMRAQIQEQSELTGSISAIDEEIY